MYLTFWLIIIKMHFDLSTLNKAFWVGLDVYLDMLSGAIIRRKMRVAKAH